MDYVKYAELVGRKTSSLGRLFYYAKAGITSELVLNSEISLLKKAEAELSGFKKDSGLERVLAKAEIIKSRITPAKDIITGIDFCTSCQTFLDAELDAPLCSKTRYARKIKKPCEDYIDSKVIDRDQEVKLAKEDFEFYNEFLRRIDEGILDNYKEILKIK